MSIQGFWADMPSSGFSDVPSDLIAVLPIGAIEQHGPHLPVSVDRDLINAVVARALPKLGVSQNVLFLPTLAITKSGEHDRFAGTLSLTAETLLAVLRDIAASVARAGVTRLVLLNGHGGNTAVLEVAARDMRMTHELIVATCSWFGFADYGEMFEQDALAVDLHAGDIETSAMLAAQPALVDMSKAQYFTTAMDAWQRDFHFIGLTGQAAKPAWIANDLNAQGACGDAANASAEKGEQLLTSAAKNFVQFLSEFARFEHRSERP